LICGCQPVKGVRGKGVGAFVGMDEEGFLAVGFLDVFVWYAGLEVQDVVGVCAEGLCDAVDFGVLPILSE
jgi:hypothetical protein